MSKPRSIKDQKWFFLSNFIDYEFDYFLKVLGKPKYVVDIHKNHLTRWLLWIPTA